MEISKGLQQEIQLVQSKLKNAIRDHQICVGKLKDDPNNADILGRIQEIQLHIVSLGRCQKQVVQRLRKEVESFKADNSKDVKVSFASLLGLNNNNNHITANNEATTEEISEVKVVTNGLDGGRYPKEDYEEIVRNGDAATPPRDSLRNKERSVSVATLSAEDEIMEVEVEDNSLETRRRDSEERLNERKVNATEQLDFLEILGLITSSRFTDLQNKRAERKRRSTANPQFVYSTWEIPTKRKRHNYLQSVGNVPQTRQTTARLNGPSPPPGTNKSTSGVASPKSTSPPTRSIAKSLIPTQKATTRPNILRNMSESRVFVNKARNENGNEPVQLSSGTKSSQQSNNSKTVHIPGLPSGLTIERIENDSAVCINCRNPGTLTNCDNCEANYHVSCHTVTPPPPRLCPKCAIRIKDGGASATTTKKNEELEEKERERYEQRERNSDLRLQVYELEKRSQLLGQSIQLQHRTRQELLGKQEKTQRSIKRLVDFIKLVQLRSTNNSSGPAVPSTSYHHRPSSSRSLRTPSPRPIVSISPISLSTINPSRSSSPIAIATPPPSPTATSYPTAPPSSSAISTQDRTSPTYLSPNPASPTTINCQTTVRKTSSSRISSSKRSRNLDSKQNRQRKRKSSSSRQLPDTLIHAEDVKEEAEDSPVASREIYNSKSSPDVSPSRSPEGGASPRLARSLASTASSTRTTNRSQSRLSTGTTTTWTNYRAARTASETRRSQSSIHQSRSEHRRNSDDRESSPKPRASSKQESHPSVGRKAFSPVTNTGQSLLHYSTQCSQAITSPITSPVILTSPGNARDTQQPRIPTKTTVATSPASNCLQENQSASHTVPTSPDPPKT